MAGYWFTLNALPSHSKDKPLQTEDFQMAPDSLLQKLGGGTIKLSDYRGKWVFLNFWATWCPPCIKEMPSMEVFYNKFKENNLTLLAVSVDAEGASVVKPFVEKYGLTFEIFLDPQNKVSKEFKVFGLPSTYVINPEGQIAAQAMGPRDWEDPVIIEYFADLMSLNKEKL